MTIIRWISCQSNISKSWRYLVCYFFLIVNSHLSIVLLKNKTNKHGVVVLVTRSRIAHNFVPNSIPTSQLHGEHNIFIYHNGCPPCEVPYTYNLITRSFSAHRYALKSCNCAKCGNLKPDIPNLTPKGTTVITEVKAWAFLLSKSILHNFCVWECFDAMKNKSVL